MITIAEYLYWRDRRSRGVYFELQAWLWREEYSAARARVLERLKFSAWQRIMQEPPKPGLGGLLKGEKAV